MLRLSKDYEPPFKINFRIEPRDWLSRSIFLPTETIAALNKAAILLKENSKGRYELVLTRGYVNWNRWRYFCGALGKAIFYCLYWNDKADATLLFSSNGHEDGLSVDIQLYDTRVHKVIKLLSWRNIMIGRTKAEKILELNKPAIDMLDMAMDAAGFVAHLDPREKLQAHYRMK